MKVQLLIKYTMAAVFTFSAAAVTVTAVSSEEALANCTLGVDC